MFPSAPTTPNNTPGSNNDSNLNNNQSSGNGLGAQPPVSSSNTGNTLNPSSNPNSFQSSTPISSPNPSAASSLPPLSSSTLTSSNTPTFSSNVYSSMGNASSSSVGTIGDIKKYDTPKKSGGFFKSKFFQYSIAIIPGIIVAAVGIFIYWYFFDDPGRLLSDGLNKIENASSLTMTFLPEAGYPGSDSHTINDYVIYNYFKDSSLLSSIQMNIDTSTGSANKDNVLITAEFNNTDLYILPTLSKTDEAIVQNAATAYSPLLGNNSAVMTQIMQDILPILEGKTWLDANYASLETYLKQAGLGDYSNVQQNTSQDTQNLKNIQQKLENAIIIEDYNSSYSFNGKTYNRILVGFDKSKLISALNYIGSLKWGTVKTGSTTQTITYKTQTDSIVKELNGSINLNQGILDVLIDGDGSIYSIGLNLPNSMVTSLSSTSSSGSVKVPCVLDAGGTGYIDQSTGKCVTQTTNDQASTTNSTNENKLVAVSKVVFSNYNSATVVSKPTNPVDSVKILNDLKQYLSTIYSAYAAG